MAANHKILLWDLNLIMWVRNNNKTLFCYVDPLARHSYALVTIPNIWIPAMLTNRSLQYNFTEHFLKSSFALFLNDITLFFILLIIDLFCAHSNYSKIQIISLQYEHHTYSSYYTNISYMLCLFWITTFNIIIIVHACIILLCSCCLFKVKYIFPTI